MATKEEEFHDDLQMIRPSDETFDMRLLNLIERLNERIGRIENYIERLNTIEAGPR